MQYIQPFGGIALFSIIALSSLSLAGALFAETVAGPIPQEKVETKAADMPEELSLMVDFASILHIEGEMSAIAVGNPDIADASLADQKTVILTGRRAGITNIIALDVSGRILAEITVRVTSQKPNMVTVRRGTTIDSISCDSPNCSGTTGGLANPPAISAASDASS